MLTRTQRKTRCDSTLPRCDPCERSNSQCEYFDSTKNRIVPRKYLVDLQDAVRRLQLELQSLEQQEDDEPDHEAMVRAPGMVKFGESNESRFLGPSSGIAVTRFVMDFARRNAERRTIRDVVSDRAVQNVKEVNNAESAKPTSKVYPLISSVAAEVLPNRGLMDQLLDLYNYKAQYMLPLLHEPSFRQDVDAVYNGSTDPTLNFQVRMVIAISMQKLDTQYAGLADSYYLAALPYLSEAIKRKDISTLQCFALMGQYSLLTPTRTAAYWMVGLASKLSQELGLCDEATIDQPPNGGRPNFLEADMRRRLFWITTSMEYGLSHSLGRPSALGVSVDNIDVKFFQLCDDKFIGPQGLAAGHYPIMKKCIAIHFFKMRLLQAEIRRTLYLRKREAPLSEDDPWFHRMLLAIDSWTRDTPKNDEGSGLSPAWFEGRKNTMIVMMYRPTPQIPNPSPEAAEKCYQAATFNVHLQKAQVEHNLIDITWIFTQAIFMALNTILWSISYVEIRDRHPIEEVQQHVENVLEAIALCADRWPGVGSAHSLYSNLAAACLRAYDPNLATSPSSTNSRSMPGHAADSGQSASTSQHAFSPGSTTATSMNGPQSPHSFASHPSAGPSLKPTPSPYETASSYNGPQHNPNLNVNTSPNYVNYSPSNLAQPMPYQSPQYEYQSSHLPASTQALPSWDTVAAPYNPNLPSFADMPLDRAPWLATFGGDFSQMGSGSMLPFQMQSLNQQEQVTDLLFALEQSELPPMTSTLGADTTVFYTAGLP